MKKLGLYLHIPFCQRRCFYCDFCSSVLLSKYKDDYLKALKRELFAYAETCDSTIDTVYIGGGTPSLLSLSDLEDLCNAIYSSFSCNIKEFTIEVNPCSDSNISEYPKIGINRLSIGIQSFNDDVLKKLGRTHDSNRAFASIKNAAGCYNNISADLIVGVSKEQDVTEDIAILSDYVQHISMYMLQIEEGTPLYRMAKKGTYLPLNDDEVVLQYERAYNACESYGYKRYEVSSFARDGYQSLHNFKYWCLDDYLGLGVSAHSLYKGRRFYNTKSIPDYITGTDKRISENYNPLKEEIMLGLRTESGINIHRINEKYGINFEECFKAAIEKNKDFITFNNEILKIKKEYFLVQNSILCDFI